MIPTVGQRNRVVRARATIRKLSTTDLVRSGLAAAAIGLLLYLVVLPIIFLIFGSVFTGRPGQEGTLTFEAYGRIVSDPRTYRLFGVSLTYATLSTAISLVFGVAMAWLLQRTDIPARRTFMLLVFLPLFVPTLLITIGWVLMLEGNIGVVNSVLRGLLGLREGPIDLYSFGGMVWINGVLGAPIVALWLWPAFASMDPGLEEAAAMSGSVPRRVLWTITLPLVRPALLAAFLISFVHALEDVTVPLLIGLPGGVTVFASQIFVSVARVPPNWQLGSAYGVILLVMTIALTVFYRRMTLHSERFVTVRGRGFRPAVMPLGGFRKPIAAAFAVFLVATVILPLLLLLWMSLSPFTQAPSLEGAARLTTRWYETMWNDRRLVEGLVTSGVLGAVASAIVMALAVVIGWIVVRARSRLAGPLDLMAFAPIAIPGLVIGVAMIWFYLTVPFPVKIYGTMAILVIAYITLFIPYGVRLSYAGFTQVHPELEDAAATSGSSWLRTLRTISVPLLAPSIFVGACFVFLRTFRELSAALLLAPFGSEPYSVVAFDLWLNGDTNKTAAYGIVAIGVMLAVVLLLGVVLRRVRGASQLLRF